MPRGFLANFKTHNMTLTSAQVHFSAGQLSCSFKEPNSNQPKLLIKKKKWFL